MGEFAEERNRIRERIWSLAEVEARARVLDVGIGEDARSTTKLIELGRLVTAIDTDLRTLSTHKDLKIDLICGNTSRLPFNSSAFDLCVAYFTLHEIDPALHPKAISELARISERVMIVEPEPGEDRLYDVYRDIWSRAMHSIRRFEDYQPIAYWRRSLEECGTYVRVCERIEHKKRLVGTEAEEFIEGAIEAVRSYGISETYVGELRDLARDVGHLGMRFSDVSVVIGDVP